MGIVAVVAVVTKDKVVVLRHDLAFVPVACRDLDIRFLQGCAIDEYRPVVHFDGLTRQCNDPLHKVASWIERKTHHHNVTTLWTTDQVRHLVHQDVLARVKVGFHAEPFHAVVLHGQTHSEENGKRQQGSLEDLTRRGSDRRTS